MITGQAEAYYGWIAVNYLLGTFSGDNGNAAELGVGSLDLGGASTQIAAAVSECKFDGCSPASVPPALTPAMLQVFFKRIVEWGPSVSAGVMGTELSLYLQC